MVVPELRGVDESAVSGTDTRAAINLLDSVLGRDVDRLPPEGAVALTASERDRLMAATLLGTYGPTVSATVTCAGCADPFDLDFSLPELLASLGGGAPSSGASGFRLPTGHDELAVAGLPVDQAEAVLLQRCVAAGADPQSAVADMELAGPIVDVDLEATCPQCGTSQPVSFDVQSYLLAALVQERPRLTGEVHVIASTYGWHRHEILDLPRSVRRQHAELIAADRAARA